MNYIVGAHMSISPRKPSDPWAHKNNFIAAVKESQMLLDANAMQIFMKSPRGRGVTKLTDEEAAEFRSYTKEIGFKYTVIHCSYLLNFAKDVAKDRWALDSLIEDLRSADKLGASGVVLHVGKFLELGYEAAFEFLIPNLKTVLAETSDLKAKIILENTAGQGTEMGRSFEELADIMHGLKSDRVHVCLDTCHSWAWGYNWHEPGKVFADFDRLIGLDRLDVIHFNDTAKELGSRVDRHANLGAGLIGLENLSEIVKFAGKKEIPVILETPERNGKTHADDMKILRGLM